MKSILTEEQLRQLHADALEWNAVHIRAVNENDHVLKERALELRRDIMNKYRISLDELVDLFKSKEAEE